MGGTRGLRAQGTQAHLKIQDKVGPLKDITVQPTLPYSHPHLSPMEGEIVSHETLPQVPPVLYPTDKKAIPLTLCWVQTDFHLGAVGTGQGSVLPMSTL